ncbi:MAG: hypothetical protein Q9187_005249 [Circinaria calcarea]
MASPTLAGRIIKPAHLLFDINQGLSFNKADIAAFLKTTPGILKANGLQGDELKSLQDCVDILRTNIENEKVVVPNLDKPPVASIKGVRVPLYSTSDMLAHILSTTGIPEKRQDPSEQATMENYYVPYLAMFHQWNNVISPKSVYQPYMASILVFGTDGLSPPLILGSSNYRQNDQKSLLIERARADLKIAGLIPKLETKSTILADNYGNCAETTQWLIMRKLGLSKAGVSRGIALEKTKGNSGMKTWDPNNVAQRLRHPCLVCGQLACQVGFEEKDIESHFGIAETARKLNPDWKPGKRQQKGPFQK